MTIYNAIEIVFSVSFCQP